MMRIYLVRHAEAEGNLKCRFQGHFDGKVSETGKKQLLLLRERFKTIHLDAVYSSPLHRAYETAKAANYYHHLPITLDKGLMEINGGAWENIPYSELPDLYPDRYYKWEKAPWEFESPGGETMQDVYIRVWNAVLAIAGKHPGQTVCVASHGCAIRNFICRAQGNPITCLNDYNWEDNTAVNIIDFDDDLVPNVLMVNDTSHLNGETVTTLKMDWLEDEKGKKEVANADHGS